MYYYIVDQLTTSAEKRKIEEIQSILSQLGIAGEFTIATPGRTVEELLLFAFKKGFTTIVSVGTDALANRVASSLIYHGYDQAAFGIIPFSHNQRLSRMVGYGSLRENCETLRTRLTMSIDALSLNEHSVIITEACIALEKPVAFQLRYDQVILHGLLTDLQIDPTGEVLILDKRYQALQKSKKARIGFWSERNKPTTGLTHLRLKRWSLATQPVCHVTVDRAVLAETPLLVERRPNALKLIVNRAKLATGQIGRAEGDIHI